MLLYHPQLKTSSPDKNFLEAYTEGRKRDLIYIIKVFYYNKINKFKSWKV